ncbi:conserved hypothetical protein (DUF1684) [Formosa sp. Hel1_33_131]|uniref:DUF1684 domain-containing protein n=1 Tax=Formosa sp. Hel1_33_131 TaxID=1336794 RepID=UPI00084E19CA|nr:DUF1684 domain-containing protein [Formosa sp. Hel1_33_131]AOR29592.1 conserved hypothetical protein (DUF1684) [Formosa sp. Hel1_33_131]
MKTILILFLGFTTIVVGAQDLPYIEEMKLFQEELNKEFKNPDKSPLTRREQKRFKGHDFFPINKSFRVEAKFIKSQDEVPFKMKTTTDRVPIYEKYGEAIFEIEDKKYKLNIYQNHRLRKMEKYRNHLFLPFTDLTNGEETYGGGRYIDLSIPDSDTIIIDFNKAYNPYCAYSSTRSCPIPPRENNLDLKVEAGVRIVNH